MYKYLAPSSPNPFSRRRRGTKGLPNKKISQYLLWGGHLVRPAYVAGKMPAPQDGIIYFLEIPKSLAPLTLWVRVKPCNKEGFTLS
ncbi:hypothetical protein FDUTEX481_10151 [Tolypothrix sp. PCC 7601]|nr:hypothetical protein FDUTEX481_10151 [Tolypothrix sp. PCC 7601]